MKEEKKETKEIPTARKKTRLVGETQMDKKNKKALELIRAYKGMFG
ncbi:hypothetical protein [Neobacillus ginsengisoli]|uniref:YfhE family protein n=1 Tax=Neobacillus ginsengisoli TaxID=904295 RepID=A0ABT9XWV6_9BACI|nr:hypothetical protein [Neobacillus ginsengisoli]MDQ0199976.1 hypothetical protein [Neobacillus ginsengisoli]